MIYLLHTHFCFPERNLYDVRDLDYFLFSGVICGIYIMFTLVGPV